MWSNYWQTTRGHTGEVGRTMRGEGGGSRRDGKRGRGMGEGGGEGGRERAREREREREGGGRKTEE